MAPRDLKQACLAVTQVMAITICMVATAGAQVPTPTPSPATTQTGAGGTSFSEAMKQLTNRSYDLLIIVRNEIEGPVLPWLEKISLSLAFLVMMVAFAKLWRENGGAGADLLWWFARLGIVFALMGNGPKIIDGMSDVGRRIATGGDSQILFKFYTDQRTAFDTAYTRFTEGTFTVRGEAVKSVPGGVLGALLSTESSVPDPVRKLESISMNMPLLYDSLSLSRGVISFGDLFLTILGSFLMIAMRLAAPVMIALAIDRSLAQRVTYPYLWGAVVLTLIWPIVALLIKAIAYMGGNIAMALGDKQQFQFDERTMQIIHSGSQNPYYTALFGSVIMLIAGLCLWAAPYIAYQLSVGRVYEGVSTTISSWAGQIIGAGLEYYSASTAAGITRQAEVLQANAQFESEAMRAEATKESGERYARASKILGVIQAGGNARYQNKVAALGANYQIGAAKAQLELMTGLYPKDDSPHFDFDQVAPRSRTSPGLIGLDMHQRRMEAYIGATQESENISAQLRGQAIGASGGTLAMVAPTFGLTGYGSTTGISSTGNFIGFAVQSKQQRDALFKAYGARLEFYGPEGQYRKELEIAQLRNNGRLITAAQNNKTGSIDASNALAREVVGGYGQAYRLTLEGNRINFDGSIRAAERVRAAGVDAARLRAVAAVVNSVGHNVARNIEQGMTLRY